MRGDSHRPISILYVLADYPVPSERFVEREIRSLCERGERVRVVTLRPSSRGPACGSNAEMCLPRPPWSAPRLWLRALRATVRAPSRATRLVTQAWRLRAEEQRAFPAWLRWVFLVLYWADLFQRDRPHVIHAHFASLPATLAALLGTALARPWGFSVHAHDFYAESVCLESKVEGASHVLACSRVLARDLRERLPVHLHGRVHVMNHGLDLSVWTPQRAEAPKGGPPLVVGVGRFQPKKGFLHLVEACAILRDEGFPIRCQLVGEGPGRQQLEREIHRRHLNASVQLLPWLSGCGLRSLFARADALAAPSLVAADGDRDNVPNVVLEAMACGLPIVASALPAIEDAFSGAEAVLLVTPGASHELAHALRDVCSDRELGARLAARGRWLVVENWNVSSTVVQLRQILAASSIGPG